MRPQSRNGFHIAIICALPLEGDAVELLFDETYDRLSQIYGRQYGDNNAYITGRIGKHNVVLCYLPGMGKGNAASAAANLRVSYHHIQLALLVGVCGGVPFPSSLSDGTEIILGDVIISDSIVEFDFGRQYPDGFRRKNDAKDTLGRPAQKIRAFISGLEGRRTQRELQAQLYQHLQALQEQPEILLKYPGVQHDFLFESSYRHKHYQQDSGDKCLCFSKDSVCEHALTENCHNLGCAGKLIHRFRHDTGNFNPSIHIGKMASADTVMKSGEDRDRLAKREGVIGFEMEGAGVWDNMPCIIIKGVCDYADSHKNKKWQNYAAATAAATTKALLEYWLPTNREDENDQELGEVIAKKHEMNVTTQDSPYLNLQRQVERQKPVLFVDPLGRVSPFHLEFIRSAEALIAVLKANLRNYGPAADMIEKGQFAIFDLATNRDIDLHRKDWDTVFLPSQAVAMSMIFTLDEDQNNSCPSCKTVCPGSTTTVTQCPTCGALFRRITDITDSNEDSAKPRQIFDEYSKTTNFWSPKKEELEKLLSPVVPTPEEEVDNVREVISLFRNVRIISKHLSSRSQKVWCNIEAWVYFYNDAPREERRGWCYVENDDTVILESHRGKDLALFVRRIGVGSDQFERDRHKEFMWREGDGTGAWFFQFQSSEDLQIIWDCIQRSQAGRCKVRSLLW